MFLTKLIRFFGISVKDRRAARLPVSFNESDLVEKFIRGWGKGGQAVNTSSNAVYLCHKPSRIEIKVGHISSYQLQCHAHRSLELNRTEARKILTRRLDNIINGENSLDAIEGAKIKERERQRAKKRRKRQKDSESSNISQGPASTGTMEAGPLNTKGTGTTDLKR